MRNIELLTTGGTIEKIYDESTGELSNRGSIVRRMLRRLRLEDTSVNVRELMSKDSLEMTDADRDLLVRAVRAAAEFVDGVVILHGTDTLCDTGRLLFERITPCPVPVVLTGAMRPYEMKQSDALQNLTEAILAASLCEPGVYVAAHSQVLAFPGVEKDRGRGTFIESDSAPS
jgi:L-asparaginase